MKTKSRNRKLFVSLINYQVLIAINIMLYILSKIARSKFLFKGIISM